MSRGNVSSFSLEDILRAITAMAGALVTSSLDAIPQVLGILGETIAVDRILLVERRHTSNGGFAGLLHSSWQGTGLVMEPHDPSPGGPSELPEVSEWFAPLMAGQPIEVHRDTSPPQVRETFERRNVQSLLLIPI